MGQESHEKLFLISFTHFTSEEIISSALVFIAGPTSILHEKDQWWPYLVFFQQLTAASRICDLESPDNTKSLQPLPTFACLTHCSFSFFSASCLSATYAFLDGSYIEEDNSSMRYIILFFMWSNNNESVNYDITV